MLFRSQHVRCWQRQRQSRWEVALGYRLPIFVLPCPDYAIRRIDGGAHSGNSRDKGRRSAGRLYGGSLVCVGSQSSCADVFLPVPAGKGRETSTCYYMRWERRCRLLRSVWWKRMECCSQRPIGHGRGTRQRFRRSICVAIGRSIVGGGRVRWPEFGFANACS